MTTQQKKELSYSYSFGFENGERLAVTVRLDPQRLAVLEDEPDSPEWTRLDFHQCSNCPLKTSEHPHCPVARHMAKLVTRFKNHSSIEPVTVIVETPERRYEKSVDLQKGLSSLLGIYIAGSGCPHTDFLRPLLKFHLPFASNHETFYRVLSMYLLAQYLRGNKSQDMETTFQQLAAKYKEIRVVNKGLRERLKAIETADANANALMILDCFALDVSFRIDQDLFSDLEKVFES